MNRFEGRTAGINLSIPDVPYPPFHSVNDGAGNGRAAKDISNTSEAKDTEHTKNANGGSQK
eukprot:3677029-Pyramimonas_sp.AAC.1